jgi:hypothetical protein
MQEEIKWTVCLTAVMVCALEFGGGGSYEQSKPVPAAQVEEAKPKPAAKAAAQKSGGANQTASKARTVRPRTAPVNPGT